MHITEWGRCGNQLRIPASPLSPRGLEYSPKSAPQYAPTVPGEKIIAWIDDEKLVDFSYAGHRLSLRAEVQLSKPFGLFTWETTGEIRNIRLEVND